MNFIHRCNLLQLNGCFTLLVQSKDYCENQDEGLLFRASEVGFGMEILIGIFSIIIFGFVLLASILHEDGVKQAH